MATAHELPHSFQEALRVAARILSANRELTMKNLIDIEAELIVLAAYRKATGRRLSRIELFSRVNDRFPESAGQEVLKNAGARAEGKLLQHLLGFQVFLDHEYEVGSDVLIPRPETEVLVTSAFEELNKAPALPRLGIEVGIGSGVISIELLSRFSSLRMIASDSSPRARARARANADRILGAEDSVRRLLIISSEPHEVLESLERELRGVKADFLITNPPYLGTSDDIDTEVREQEPMGALFPPAIQGAEDPLYFYRKISESAASLLVEGGWVFAELAHERAQATEELFKDKSESWVTRVLPDLTGRPRVLIARRKQHG